ncbi:MAG: hypothetical protein K5768_03465 [Firmicutes bacterium]|nr:hypothetical protein [Bacillota bacterium]
MGGGRDFTGQTIYKRVNGRYIRQVPYKKDILQISSLEITDSYKVDTSKKQITINNISKTKNFSQLESELEKTFGYVEITQQLRKYGNFELVKSGMVAVERMTKLFPMLKNSGLIMRMDGGSREAISGIDFDNNLHFYYNFFKKDNPESIFGNGKYHPKNFSYEQVIAHELGHKLELIFLQKVYPKVTDRQLKALFQTHEGFTYISKVMYQKLYNKGYRGHATEMMKAVSGYAKKNWAEFGAEAIGDVYSNGSKASSVSQLFVLTLLEEFDKLNN